MPAPDIPPLTTALASPRAHPTSQPQQSSGASLTVTPTQPPVTAPQPVVTAQTPPATPPLSTSPTPANGTPPTSATAADHSHPPHLHHSRIEPPPRPNYAFTRTHHRRTTSDSITSTLGQPPSRTHSFAFAAADNNAKRNIPQLSSQHKHELPYTILQQLFRRWLPSLFSPRPIRHTFPRNLDNAVRALIAFIVAAVIAVQPWAVGLLAVPYLFLVFATITVRSTVGATLTNIDAQLKGVLAATAIDMIVTGAQVSRLSQTSRIIVCEVVLFVTSIGLAYYFHPPLARRFSLAIHSLIMLEIALGVDQVVLPLQILLCLVLAYTVSLLLVLLPFPRLARDELLDRYQQALLTLSEVFGEVIQCYLSTEPIAPQVLHTQVKSQLEAVFKSLTVMRRLQNEVRMEASLFSLIFPLSMGVGSAVLADPDRIEQLYWIDMNLLNTLSTLHYSSYHAAFAYFLRDAFTQLSHEQSSYLELLGRADSHIVTKEAVNDCKQRLDAAMTESWAAYTRARRSLYGLGTFHEHHSAEHVRAAAERRKRRHSIGSGMVGQHYHSDGEMETDTDTAVSGQPQESLRLLVREEMRADETPLLRSPADHQPISTLQHSTVDVFLRSSFFFYVTRFHHALHLLPLDDEVLCVVLTASKQQPATSQPTAPSSTRDDSLSASSWPRKRLALNRVVRDHLRHPLQWSLLGLHPVRDFLYLFTALGEWVRHPSVDWSWLRSSIKISLIICVASLIAVIPQIGATTIFVAPNTRTYIRPLIALSACFASLSYSLSAFAARSLCLPRVVTA